MSKDDECVLCVPRKALEDYYGGGLFQGFHGNSDPVAGRDLALLPTILRNGVAKFVRRGDCEQDPSLKQIIPYVMLTCSAYGQQQVFRYNRAAKGEGESRLAGKAAVGIGGHINVDDHQGNFDFYATFGAACSREITEEVKIASAYKIVKRGFLNDDSDAVGRVHFGVLVELQLELPCVYPNEPNIVHPHFMPLSWFTDAAALNFESWSQIALRSASSWMDT